MDKLLSRCKNRIKDLSYRRKLILTCLMVSILPLLVTTVFCYVQVSRNLLQQEKTALEYTLHTASSSLDSQIVLYENLLQYVSLSEPVITTASRSYDSVYDEYAQYAYSFDVFLNSIYTLHREIRQITVYTTQPDLQHGKQLQPLSALAEEPWFTGFPQSIGTHPSWFRDDSGDLIVLVRIPAPFSQYIKAYSNNCVAIRIDGDQFFYFLDQVTDDYRLEVSRDGQTFFDYASPSILENPDVDMTSMEATGERGWRITLEKPYPAIVRSARQMTWVLILIMAICLVVILLLSGIFSDFFVRRVHRLNQAMEVIQAGNFNIHIQDECHDEIGVMTNNFQIMADQIGTLIEEKYQAEITMKEAQLKALQAQINPHFLYNCLSLINSRALLTHQEDIGRMSQLMSTFYRTTLNKGKSDILLKDEIRNVQSYLEIQQLLHDQTFDVQVEIDPLLPEIRVPNLILQPLVENSIVHGILPKGESGGKLYLIIRKVDQSIHFMVMDNGLGIPPEKIPTLTRTDSNGYGLKNVNERLVLTYGPESALRINSIPNESTMITFRIPL